MMQVIDKRRLNMEVEDKDLLLDQLRKEIEILQRLSHPNIVAFEEVCVRFVCGCIGPAGYIHVVRGVCHFRPNR